MTGEILEGCVCPICGGEIINDGYDMDFDVINCHCTECDWEGNDSQCIIVDDDDDDI